MARQVDHDRDCSNQLLPVLCALALRAAVTICPAGNLWRWGKLTRSCFWARKRRFVKRLFMTMVVPATSTRVIFLPLVERVRMIWFLDWACSIAPV